MVVQDEGDFGCSCCCGVVVSSPIYLSVFTWQCSSLPLGKGVKWIDIQQKQRGMARFVQGIDDAGRGSWYQEWQPACLSLGELERTESRFRLRLRRRK